ncbi:hypothetical protein B0A49_04973 [Cryomyces minteri]|uniref:Uncharacterized protein n=1 Tax=Cryomyces minteri TaxID=331657 RepID=A0A4V5NFU9_9PEZI|nr:hypothetical protein B0A49_04973 [Cryomyces minteri]
MTTASTAVSILVVIVTLLAAAVYLFGVPPRLKRLLSNTAALLTVPTAASYLVKDQVDKLPASDQKDIKDLKAGLGNALGGSLQNPLGEIVGNTGDSLSSPYTDR